MFLESGGSEGMAGMQGLKGHGKSNHFCFSALNPLAGVCVPVPRGTQVASGSPGEPASWFTGLPSVVSHGC